MMLCLVTVVTLTGHAQSKTAAKTAEQKAKELQEKLHLSNSQTVKVTDIYDQSAREFEKIRTEEHGDNSKMAIKLAPLRRETLKKIKTVLTPSQNVKFDKMIKDSSAAGEGWSNGWTANS